MDVCNGVFVRPRLRRDAAAGQAPPSTSPMSGAIFNRAPPGRAYNVFKAAVDHLTHRLARSGRRRACASTPVATYIETAGDDQPADSGRLPGWLATRRWPHGPGRRGRRRGPVPRLRRGQSRHRRGRAGRGGRHLLVMREDQARHPDQPGIVARASAAHHRHPLGGRASPSPGSSPRCVRRIRSSSLAMPPPTTITSGEKRWIRPVKPDRASAPPRPAARASASPSRAASTTCRRRPRAPAGSRRR